MRRLSWNFVMVNDFWQSYAPLALKKKEEKFSVSFHYLPNGCAHSTQI
jgi:hypothetical protein